MPVALPRVHVPGLPKISLPPLPSPGDLLDRIRGRGTDEPARGAHPSDSLAVVVEAVGLGAHAAALPVAMAGLLVRQAVLKNPR